MADQRLRSRPVHLQGVHPRHRLGARVAALAGQGPARAGLQNSAGRGGRLAHADPVVARAHRGAEPAGIPHQGPRAGAADRVLLPLPCGVRPMGQRDGHAVLDRGCRAAGNRWRTRARHPRLPQPALRAGHHSAPRPDADCARVRLPGAGAVPVRFRPGGRHDRDRHLRHAAHGARHHAGPQTSPRGDQGVRPHGRLQPAPDDLEGPGPGGPAHPDGRSQPGDHALAQHGDHRLDDRSRRTGP